MGVSVCDQVFDGTSSLASFTTCQKGLLTCPIPPYPPKLCVPVHSEWVRSWGNVLYLQYPGLPEPSGWGGIIVTGHFTLLSRAGNEGITRTSLVGETERGLLLPRPTRPLGTHFVVTVWFQGCDCMRERGKTLFIINCWGTICRFLISIKVCVQPQDVEHRLKLCWNEQGRIPIYFYLRILMIPFPSLPPNLIDCIAEGSDDLHNA